MKRYLAIDPGQRWVGLAHSDPAGTIATPHDVVDRKNESLSGILESLIDEKNIDEVIVGYPTPLKTDENERTRQVDQFIEQFVSPLPVPHQTISERYSTKDAERLRDKRGDVGGPDDDEAAAMILEYYLERQSGPAPSREHSVDDDSS